METAMQQDALPLTQREKTACFLLDLPAELRNRLYEYALIEDQIIVTSELKQLALLNTCRKIRNETLKLWYTGNHFTITVKDFDMTESVKFLLHANRILGSMLLIETKFRGRNVWANALVYCKLLFEHREETVVWINPVWEDRARATTISARMGILRAAHRIAMKEGRTWPECAEEMEEVRPLVTSFASNWF